MPELPGAVLACRRIREGVSDISERRAYFTSIVLKTDYQFGEQSDWGRLVRLRTGAIAQDPASVSFSVLT